MKNIAAILFLTAFLCTPASGAQFEKVSSHTGPAVAVSVSRSLPSLLTAGSDGAVSLFGRSVEMTNGIIHGSMVSTGDLSQNGRFAATASPDGSVKLWDASSGALIKTLLASGHYVFSCAFSHDSALLATAGAEIMLWDTASFNRHKTIKPQTPSRAAVFSPDNSYFAFSSGREIFIWSLSSNKLLSLITRGRSPELKKARQFSHHLLINALSFSSDSQYLVSAGEEGVISCFRTEDGYRLWRSAVTGTQIRALLFLKDNNIVLAAGTGGLIYIHDSRTGKINGSIGPLPASVNSLAFYEKKSELYAACADGGVYRIKTSYKAPFYVKNNFLITAGLIFLALLFSALVLYVISAFRDKSVKDWKP